MVTAMTDGNTNAEAVNRSGYDPAPFWARILMCLAVLAFVGTYVATQVDFLRRHRPGISPAAYLQPQALQILAPGLGLAAAFGIAAVIVTRFRRRTASHPLGPDRPTD